MGCGPFEAFQFCREVVVGAESPVAVPISGDKKTAVSVYEVGPGEVDIAYTRVVVESYNL